MIVFVEGRKVVFTKHAIRRYTERVSRFEGDAARVELQRVAGFAVLGPEPTWHFRGEPADGWLLLGDGIAFPLQRFEERWLAVTCVCRAEEAEAFRAHRRAERRSKRAAARTKRWVARQRLAPGDRRGGRPDGGWRDAA